VYNNELNSIWGECFNFINNLFVMNFLGQFEGGGTVLIGVLNGACKTYYAYAYI